MSALESMTREEELAALIEEQSRDDEWGHRVDHTRVPHNMRAVSLDFTFGDGDSAGETIGVVDHELEVLIGGAETAVRRIPRPQRWTKRGVVSAIKKWVAEHGEIPDHKDWSKPDGRGIPSSASLARHFGSFNNAIRAAGFEPRGIGKSRCNPNPRKFRPRIRPQKRTARLKTGQLAAAHVIYEREGLSMRQLADLLWEKYDYPDSAACRRALNLGFHAEGFRVRTKSEARMRLAPEHRAAIAAKASAGRKWKHLTAEEVAAIRASREWGKTLAERYGVSQSRISRIRRGMVTT